MEYCNRYAMRHEYCPDCHMNQLVKTLVCGVAGTTVMTADSALMSRLFGENYREPEHLATMIKRLAPGLSKHEKTDCRLGGALCNGLGFCSPFCGNVGKQTH